MKMLSGDKASRFLIYGILATLPLERIPSLELAHPVSATIRISQILGLILIAINLPVLWRSKAQLLKGPWIWLVGFLAVCGLSSLYAIDPKRALIVTMYMTFVSLLAWTISLRFEPSRINSYLKVLFASALVACAFGFYQFFGDLLGLSTSLTGLRPQYSSAVFGFPSIQSTGLEPLYFDNFLLIATGLSLSFYLMSRRLRWLGALIIFSTIIALNVSRGAAIAALVMAGLSVVFAAYKRQFIPALGIIAGLIVSGGIAVLLIILGSHIASSNNAKRAAATKNFTHQVTNVSSGESVEFRTLSRNEAISTWKNHPLLGVGAGNYGFAAHKDKPLNFRDSFAIVNNEPLELLAETGILGTLFVLVFALSLMRTALISLPVRREPLYAFAGGLLLMLIGTAIQYQTFSTLYITHIWVAIGLFYGALLCLRKPKL